MVTGHGFHQCGHGGTNIPQVSADWQDAWPGEGVGGQVRGWGRTHTLTWTPEVTRKGASHTALLS